jgi:hypothetical protein
VDIPRDLTLYHYDVVIEPDVPRAVKRRVMVEAVKNHRGEFCGQFPVFDGEKGLYCHRKLSASPVGFGQTPNQKFCVKPVWIASKTVLGSASCIIVKTLFQ